MQRDKRRVGVEPVEESEEKQFTSSSLALVSSVEPVEESEDKQFTSSSLIGADMPVEESEEKQFTSPSLIAIAESDQTAEGSDDEDADESEDSSGDEHEDAAADESEDAAADESEDSAGGDSEDAAGGDSEDAAADEQKDADADEQKDADADGPVDLADLLINKCTSEDFKVYAPVKRLCKMVSESKPAKGALKSALGKLGKAVFTKLEEDFIEFTVVVNIGGADFG